MTSKEFAKTKGGKLFAKLNRELMRCIYVSNECLPDDFQDKRTDGVSLAKLNKKCEERELLSNFEYARQQRAKRVELYANDIANGREINYVMK